MFWTWTLFGGGNLVLVSIWIGVFCFVMTMEGNIALLSAIPGPFVGAAVLFGNLGGPNGDLVATLINTLICLLLGSLFGILSATLPDLFKRRQPVAEA